MQYSIDVQDDLTAALNKLEANLGEEVLRATGFAGAEVLRDEVRRRAPVLSGVLRNNVIVKRIEEESDAGKRQVYLVTVRAGKQGAEGDAYYWKWVDAGHRYVRAKPKGTTWKAHRAASEIEYGTSKKGARPFMRPAYTAQAQAATEAMRVKFSEKLAEVLAR